jgi:hypothetical protein
MKPPTDRERQIMQRLRSGGWIKAFTLQDSLKTTENLLAKARIEARGSDGDMTYRLTETGLEAKKSPVRIS